MTFKEWLKAKEINEVGTGTSAIAVFARPIFSEPVRRATADDLALGEKKKKNCARCHKDN